jgi:putative ATP-binding cassette transporter
MIKLFRFLIRSSKGAFVLGGAGGVGLLALVPSALRGDGPPALRLGLLFAALCLLTVAARVATQVAMIRIAQGSVAGLVRNLCERILALPLRSFEENDPGRLTAVLTEDVMVLTNALSGVPLLLVNLTVVLGCFVYLGFVSPTILACSVLFAVPAVLSHQLLNGYARGMLGRARRDQDELVGHFRALVEGFKELKLHRDRREAFLSESIHAAAARVREGNTAGLSMFAFVGGWGQLLYFAYLGFLAFALPSLVDVPRESVVAAVLTLLYVMSPLDSVLNWLPVVARAAISMRRIEELGLSLEACARPEAGLPTAKRSVSLDGPVVLQGLTYTYPSTERGGEGFTLGPLDLTVHPGELLFLVGGNGSGKTTLVKLLTGLYAPETGSVSVDRYELEPEDDDAYRALFTVVFADGFLFPTLLGLDAPDLDERASDLITELGLEGVVKVENGAFSTTNLSQGQRKRLALLAACLEDRPVLVLDEWASYQDPRFKRAFYLEILPALQDRGKTLVVISHDEEFFDVADRVVHLTSGVVSTGGTTPPETESLPPKLSS